MKSKPTEAEQSDVDKKNIDASNLGNVMTAEEAAIDRKLQQAVVCG